MEKQVWDERVTSEVARLSKSFSLQSLQVRGRRCCDGVWGERAGREDV